MKNKNGKISFWQDFGRMMVFIFCIFISLLVVAWSLVLFVRIHLPNRNSSLILVFILTVMPFVLFLVFFLFVGFYRGFFRVIVDFEKITVKGMFRNSYYLQNR